MELDFAVGLINEDIVGGKSSRISKGGYVGGLDVEGGGPSWLFVK